MSWEEHELQRLTYGREKERQTDSLVLSVSSKEQGPAIWAVLRRQRLCALLSTN